MKQRVVVFPFYFLILLLTLTTSTRAQQPPLSQSELDNYVKRVIQQFEVPGLSVAVVKDGKVVLAKGYGVRTLGKQTPVDAQTLFGIASNTKAFTATALALLVEEGKLAWDGRVIDYLPWFQMSDPYVTREITIRDLLCHRSGLGLGAGDLLLWPLSRYTRNDLVRRLRYVPLATSFRSAFAYDNVLYVVAGEVIEAVSGQTYEDFVTSRILKPVGMSGSFVFRPGVTISSNVATTHAKVEGVVKAVAPFYDSKGAPAGGINSNAEDMAKWMITQLDSGQTISSQRLFSASSTRELWKLTTPIYEDFLPLFFAPGQLNVQGYGLGFFVRDYRGHQMIWHTGGLPGYLSMLALLPEQRLGVTVLTNQESESAFRSIICYVLDLYLKAPKHDWINHFKELEDRELLKAASATNTATAARDSSSRPSRPLQIYCGTYRDAWYGDVTISLENNKLVIRFKPTPDLVGDLDFWQYDTFIARWRNRELRADAYVTFHLSPEGTIEEAKMKPVSPLTDFSFDFQDLVLKPVSERK